jgi:hypothetical protein
MAARLRKTHQDDVRLKIQTSQLINRLQNYALGDSDDEISMGRMKAIEILLRKSLPDLSAVSMEVGGKEGAPAVRVEIVKSEAK